MATRLTLTQARESTLYQLFRTLDVYVRAEARAPNFQVHYTVRFKTTGHTLEGTDVEKLYEQARDYERACLKLTGEKP